MSVQLIVYPQNYQGFGSVTSTATNEFLSDGIDFNTVNNSTEQAVTLPNGTQEAIDFYNPTMAVNTWYRYYEGSSVVSASGGVLTIVPSAVAPQQGILQKLSNLTVGGVYNITIDSSLIINTTNAFGVWIYSGTVLQYFLPITSAGVVTLPFTANSTEDTIVIAGSSTIAQLIQITSVSVTNAVPVPSGAIQLLEDGQVICDLYEDEDLPLTLSVDDFKNVAEKVQSYSKAFNLPSTKRNNRIFDHIFEITRDVASAGGLLFNPYKRTKCVLKQDGFILFEGYLRMLDITDKEGEISYNVNLYSEVIALADTLKDRAFRDLDFTELEHDYNYTEIRNSWQGTLNYTNTGTSGFRSGGTVRYPFVDWNHNYSFTSGGMPELLTLESSFRPFISIKYLIDRIFEASEFTYESAFFNTTDFEKLYMDFNWGADNTPSNVSGSTYVGQAPYAATVYLLPFATSTFANLQLGNYQNNVNVTPPNYDQSTNILTATQTNETYAISYEYTCNPGSNNIYFQWLHTNAAGVPYPAIDSVTNPTTSSGFITYLGSFTVVMQIGDTLEAQFRSDGIAAYQYSSFLSTVNFIKSISAVTSQTFLQTLRGELGQWDFLKGLLTMFNLVTLPDENNPNNIIIEPYSDIFIPTATGGTTLANRGIEHDWTDKIDVSQMKLEPLADLNKKTMFKFVEDDDDYSFNQYKNSVGGHLYGSNEYDAWNEFNILEGEEEIIAEPFAATIVKPLMSQFPEFITPAIYARGGDATWEGFENSPRIMYNNGVVDMASTTYSVPAQNGVLGNSVEFQFLQFSHLTEIPTSSASPSTTIDFHFGICQLMTGVGAATPNNLFNTYWLPYYSELYNPNTRTMTIKVNLSPSDINTFKFNDKVFIKNRVFRVNKIDYKPNDLATVEFILIP